MDQQQTRQPRTEPSITGLLGVAVLCLLVSQNPLAAKQVTIGTGSGYLNYPTAQTTLNLQPGDTLYIAAGTYSGISLNSLVGTAAAPITVKCDPNTVFTTATTIFNSFTTIAFVSFENFRYQNYAGRCMMISGASHDLVFKNFICKGVTDYGFFISDTSKLFDGTKASAFYNLKWQNCVFSGFKTAAIITGGGWADLKSTCLDFEVTGCTFSMVETSPIEANNSFNLQIHDSTFSDSGGRTFVGHMANIVNTGYCKVYNNRFTRTWGDDVRVMPLKLNALGYNGTDAVNRFYNNLSYEKKKYAMVEVNGVNVTQADIDNSRGFLARTSAEIYFNTLYRSRKVDYVAPLVDIYAPNITISHNVVVEPECDAAFDSAHNYVYSLGTGQQSGLVVTNNLVYKTLALSGLSNAESFTPSATSPVKDASTGTVNYITDDFYHRPRYRGTAADLGAVERQ